MKEPPAAFIAEAIGNIPNRLQLAGGCIDQLFVSKHNPNPPGSMVVVQVEPDFRPMDRSGIASGKREYCEQNGIQYRVLQRLPAPGLPKSSSTGLRGF